MDVILGKGQVGDAIGFNIDGNVRWYDKGQWEHLRNQECFILHICFPYSRSFVKTVKKAQSIFKYKALVIHSTVKPGTTKKIIGACYSPVNGRHGDGFAESIRNFPKYLAGNPHECDLIKVSLGKNLRCEYWSDDTTSLEFAKVMCTSYMYWCLVYEKTIYEQCKKLKLNYHNVYTRWQRMYNDGYGKQHFEWRRPVYDHMEGKLPGGHCLRPNIHLTDNFITKTLRRYER